MKKRTAMFRGLKGSCPKCGQAPLFRGYMKPVTHCAHCEMEWTEVRADIAPSWATMTLVAHLMAPFFHFLIFNDTFPTWVFTLIMCIVAIILVLLILPRMKGLFLGLIWVTGARDSTFDESSI